MLQHSNHIFPCIQSNADIRADTIRDLPGALLRIDIRNLLLDWDGCMTRVSGEWHALIALSALNHSDTFRSHASVTLDEARAAYEGPGHGIDWFTLFERNLIRPKLAHCESADLIVNRVMHDLHHFLPAAADDFASRRLGADLILDPQPGVVSFLEDAQASGIKLTVITMTPTIVVKALAVRSGLSAMISDFFGCDYFTSFSEGKSDPALWRAAAKMSGCNIAEAAIVEDSPRSLRGAVRSGASMVVAMQDDVDELSFLRLPGTELWSAKKLGDMHTVERFDYGLYY